MKIIDHKFEWIDEKVSLRTYKIKDVFKIEKKSYFFGNLRYKLNPILHKYFKITI